jgi:hypothetical protein
MLCMEMMLLATVAAWYSILFRALVPFSTVQILQQNILIHRLTHHRQNRSIDDVLTLRATRERVMFAAGLVANVIVKMKSIGIQVEQVVIQNRCEGVM